jgi:diaminopimelate decarboxylase
MAETSRQLAPATDVAELDLLETPAYVYDLDELRRSHAALRAAIPPETRLFYSLKANPHPAVVRALCSAGCSPEACSPGELEVALAAGASPDTILYTGPGKRDGEVAAALAAGVRWFSVDSPAGLDQVDRLAASVGATAQCLLRLNGRSAGTAQGLTMTGVASQFGADETWVLSQPRQFSSRPRAEVAGFHLYTGSNLESEAALLAQFEASLATARRAARALEVEPRLLDLGGGFGAPYARAGALLPLDGLASGIAALLGAWFPGWRRRQPLVAFESGRYLTATCGSLLARVLDVKRSHGTPVVVLESGINHLGGMSGLRRLPPLVPDVQSVAAADDSSLRGAILAGPLCTPLDVWARSADLPDLEIGDVVRIPNVGAYGLCASLLAFLSHPAPREVVVDGGEIVDVSRLQLVRRGLEASAGDANGYPDGRQ